MAVASDSIQNNKQNREEDNISRKNKDEDEDEDEDECEELEDSCLPGSASTLSSQISLAKTTSGE
jgi:hypothetical protein